MVNISSSDNIPQLRQGFDLLSDHVVITDAAGRILYLNPAAERKTGFSAAEAIGKKPGELWGGGMPAEFYKKMFQTIKTEKQPFVGEVRNKKKDGEEYWQELHISPVLDESGEAKYFIAIEPDITELKKKQKFRNDFISALAHQARSPLTATKWGLELLLEHGGLDEVQKQSLKHLADSNLLLIDIINKLLEAARAPARE